MIQIPLPATSLKLSPICFGLGATAAWDPTHVDKLFDHFIEKGGNFFDSAHVYSFWLKGGTGASELIIGDYLQKRGHKNMIVATKGGHPSSKRYRTVDQYLSRERIAADIDDSLARLGIDCIDLYYLHRDDTRVPVSEIMETLNAEVKRGRIRYLGASNWTTSRISEANTYAREHHFQGFVISEICWSLAKGKHKGDPTMLDASPADILWHTENRFPLASYSPNAAGYFSSNPKADGNFATPENFGRRERATQLSKKYDVQPSQIALAYLTSHPFPVFPILGTQNLEHLQEAIDSTEIKLTPEEIRWIEQG